jgi:homoserine dehydrogenase
MTGDIGSVEEVFGKVKTVGVPDVAGEFGFVTAPMSEAEFEEKAAGLPDIITRIRMRA